jgi:hypothetical protein
MRRKTRESAGSVRGSQVCWGAIGASRPVLTKKPPGGAARRRWSDRARADERLAKARAQRRPCCGWLRTRTGTSCGRGAGSTPSSSRSTPFMAASAAATAASVKRLAIAAAVSLITELTFRGWQRTRRRPGLFRPPRSLIRMWDATRSSERPEAMGRSPETDRGRTATGREAPMSRTHDETLEEPNRNLDVIAIRR